MNESIKNKLFVLAEDLISKSKLSISNAIDAVGTPDFMQSEGVQEFIKNITSSFTTLKADAYDKSLDAIYNQSHIGGANHRLFDNSHDLLNAWDKAKDALPNDTTTQEIFGMFTASWKDLITTKGLPFTSVDKDSFEKWTDKISSAFPNLSRDYFTDMLQLNVAELISATFGIVSLVFFLNKNEKEKFSEILGAMGISSLTSANPLMGILSIIIMGYTMYKRKDMISKKDLLKGGSVAAISTLLFALLGLPFIVEFVLVLIVCNTVKKHIFEKDILKFITESIQSRLAKKQTN